MADMIGIEEVKEHGDGSATFTVVVDDQAQTSLANEGLKLVLYCAAASMDIQTVYDFIEDHIRYENDQKIRPMTYDERKRASERDSANSSKNKGK